MSAKRALQPYFWILEMKSDDESRELQSEKRIWARSKQGRSGHTDSSALNLQCAAETSRSDTSRQNKPPIIASRRYRACDDPPPSSFNHIFWNPFHQSPIFRSSHNLTTSVIQAVKLNYARDLSALKTRDFLQRFIPLHIKSRYEEPSLFARYFGHFQLL